MKTHTKAMSLYSQIYPGESSFSEADFYEAVRYVLGTESYHLNQEDLENSLLNRLDEMSESEAESFWSSLGNVARSIGGGLLKVASVAAPIVGTAFGGPIGGTIGGLVGNLANAGGDALLRRPGGRQQLQQTWRQTRNYAGGAVRAVLPAAQQAFQQYVTQNPVQYNPAVAQNINHVRGAVNQVATHVNNPALQAALAQGQAGAVAPTQTTGDAPSLAEMIESLHTSTGSLLSEFYENGYLPAEDYAYDRYGRIVPLRTFAAY